MECDHCSYPGMIKVRKISGQWVYVCPDCGKREATPDLDPDPCDPNWRKDDTSN